MTGDRSPIRDPVILLGSPRSGTTLLFNALSRSPALWSLGVESHAVFEGPFHPSLRGWSSNALGAGDLDPGTRRRILDGFRRRARPGTVWQMKEGRGRGGEGGLAARAAFTAARVSFKVRRVLSREPIRLVEKTPRNALRVPFLRALFPDARFVFLRRDGREVVSSLMEGWMTPGWQQAYAVPEPVRIPGYPGKKWCFLIPPGWRELLDRPLEEVCAAQWTACMEALLKDLEPLRSEGRVHDVSYEEVVADPAAALRRLCAFAGIPSDDGVLPEDGRLAAAASLSPPAPGKWRRLNGPAVERVLPLIAPWQRELGYPEDMG